MTADRANHPTAETTGDTMPTTDPDPGPDTAEPGTAERPDGEPEGQDTDPAPASEPDDPQAVKARREARGVRERLRATETERDNLAAERDALVSAHAAERDSLAAERDALAARVNRVQADRAAELAAEVLKDGTDLWRAGVLLADLLSEGDVDRVKVEAAARRVGREHPHWSLYGRPMSGRPRLNLKGGGRPDLDAEPGWRDVLNRT